MNIASFSAAATQRRPNWQTSVRHGLWLWLYLLTLLSGTGYALADHYSSSLNPATIQTAPVAATLPAPETAAASQPASIVAAPKPVSAGNSVPAAPTCNPATNYGTPSKLDLSAAPAGLTQLTDPAYQYQVFGYTAGAIRNQLQHCAPSSGGSGAEFTADTGYSLSWQYDYTSSADGLCTVSNAKIGLHLNMVLPYWQPTPYATAGLNAQWQSFVSGLQTHENGHAALDRQYAAQLLSDLQAFPATSCTDVSSAVNAKMQADVNALNAANDAYDAATNHGASQGANLPS